MTSKYIYKGMDLTLDIYEKIRHVVELIAEAKQISFDEAYFQFAQSHTYWCLATPATAMWGESDEFILDEYLAETDEVNKET